MSFRQMVKIRGELTYPLPEPLIEPTLVKDFFPPEMFEDVKAEVSCLGLGTDALQFHTMLARWESPILFSESIETYCLSKAREIFGDDTLKKAYFFAVRYQRKDGCIPHLWEHTDQNGTQTTIDITVENTADWGLIVEGQHFQQVPNNAVAFAGQQHIHSRPPYPTQDPDAFTTVLFLHFTQPDHWMQSEPNGIYKYGSDGDIRFFNRNRFLAMPDGPVNQPVCDCHNYGGTLNLYDSIVGDEFLMAPELCDLSVMRSEEVDVGIFEYWVSKKQSRIIQGLMQNSMFKMWEPAQILMDEKPTVDESARNCFNYFLTHLQGTCHPQDPIRRLRESVDAMFDEIASMYSERYFLPELVSNETVLLRYEEGNFFHPHFDEAKQFPRNVSMTYFVNDNYEGGELEFVEFGVRSKPEAGKVVVFSSAYPYMHTVKPVSKGIRYAIVKWYAFA